MIPVVVATAAALGLASGTHCTLMCGPLVGGACTSKGAVDRGEAARYQLGRSASYVFVGVVAASVGRPFIPARIAGAVQIAASIAVAVVLVVRAIRSTRSSDTPAAPLVALRTPSSSSSSSSSLLAPLARLARNVARGGLGLGLVTGIFPCGALFGALLVAATSGSAAMGALAMLVFSLASAPFLVAALLVGDRAARWVRSQRRATRAFGLALTCAMAVAMVMLPVVVAAKRTTPTPAPAPAPAQETMPPDCPFHRKH